MENKNEKEVQDNNNKKQNKETQNDVKKGNTKTNEIKESKDVKENKNENTKIEPNEKVELIKTEDIEIDEKKLKKINEEIKENKKKSRNNEAKNEKYIRIFRNAIIAIIGVAYISITIMGAKRIPQEQFQTDLKVFIILSAIIGIMLFEKAYKTDKFRFALVGIEVLVLGASTIAFLQLYKKEDANLLKYSKFFILFWIVYYVIKNIAIAVKKIDKNK